MIIGRTRNSKMVENTTKNGQKSRKNGCNACMIDPIKKFKGGQVLTVTTVCVRCPWPVEAHCWVAEDQSLVVTHKPACQSLLVAEWSPTFPAYQRLCESSPRAGEAASHHEFCKYYQSTSGAHVKLQGTLRVSLGPSWSDPSHYQSLVFFHISIASGKPGKGHCEIWKYYGSPSKAVVLQNLMGPGISLVRAAPGACRLKPRLAWMLEGWPIHLVLPTCTHALQEVLAWQHKKTRWSELN